MNVPSRSETGRNGEELALRLREYLTPSLGETLGQVAGSVVPYFLFWYAAYRSLEVSYGLTLILAIPAGAFLLRIFVLQHDLGHGALFRSKRANDVLGSIFGVLTLIPFHHWRRLHVDHHGHFGDLDHRGPGCVSMLTVSEYLASTRLERLLYRLRRNPVVIFTVGGLYHFLVQHRYPYDAEPSWKKERRSVHLTSLALLALALGLGSVIGFGDLVRVHLPVVYVMSSFGVWIFLIQHGFEDTYWERTGTWSFVEASIRGSSYLDLPRPLQWLTANVGFHHVHHLNPKIPNYRLESCHRENPGLQEAHRLTLLEGLRKPWLALWDEDRGKLIRFRDLDPRPARRALRCGRLEQGAAN